MVFFMIAGDMTREGTMKKIFFVFAIVFIYAATAFSGELYSCKDSTGASIITSAPQDDMTDCVLKDSYEPPVVEVKTIKKYANGQEVIVLDKEEIQKRQEADAARQKEHNRITECREKCSKDLDSCSDDCDRFYRRDIKGRNSCGKSCKESASRCYFNNGCQ